jgi:hypothetical protein
MQNYHDYMTFSVQLTKGALHSVSYIKPAVALFGKEELKVWKISCFRSDFNQ